MTMKVYHWHGIYFHDVQHLVSYKMTYISIYVTWHGLNMLQCSYTIVITLRPYIQNLGALNIIV